MGLPVDLQRCMFVLMQDCEDKADPPFKRAAVHYWARASNYADWNASFIAVGAVVEDSTFWEHAHWKNRSRTFTYFAEPLRRWAANLDDLLQVVQP